MKFQMFRTTFPKHQAGSVKSFLHPSLLPLLHMLITHCKQYFTSLQETCFFLKHLPIRIRLQLIYFQTLLQIMSVVSEWLHYSSGQMKCKTGQRLTTI